MIRYYLSRLWDLAKQAFGVLLAICWVVWLGVKVWWNGYVINCKEK